MIADEALRLATFLRASVFSRSLASISPSRRCDSHRTNMKETLTCCQTKGRTFQELDELFEAKTPTRRFKRAKTQLQLAEGLRTV